MVETPNLGLCGRPVGVSGSVFKLDADVSALVSEVGEAILSGVVGNGIRKSLPNQEGMCAGAEESKKAVFWGSDAHTL
jgi:hypothetical protein